MHRIARESDGLLPAERKRALDFGCGAGRLTQALAQSFDSVVGVDIAPSMIDIAHQYDRSDGRCTFILLEGQDLHELEDASFDFVYTAHVLQHMHPRYAERYVAEFMRVLKPGGTAFVQLPTQQVRSTASKLPADGYRARLDILNPPREIVAGETQLVEVRVVNASPVAWGGTAGDGSHLVALGDHWRTEDGTVVTFDDARTVLPFDLVPGASCLAELFVRAPNEPGCYILEIDLVHDPVAWFAQLGSPTAKCAVMVTPADGGPPSDFVAPAEPEPTMQMYGTPERVVRKWVQRSGGAVVSVFDWDEVTLTKATDWERRGYIVRRNDDSDDDWRSILRRARNRLRLARP